MTEIPIRQDPDRGEIIAQARSLVLAGITDISILANISSLLYWSIPDINWTGFYLADEVALYLGPFHGKPACVVIPFGTGVCGAAAVRRATINVPDVAAFPNHIACDSASRSEIVVPLLSGDALLGVLDVDSPSLARVDAADPAFFEEIAAIVTRAMARARPRSLKFVP
jgi:L-methionine (R)-S-oxide reductase